jgi:DNA-binding IclR family transcriptional regulator
MIYGLDRTRNKKYMIKQMFTMENDMRLHVKKNDADAPGYKAPAVVKAFRLLAMVSDSDMELGISELARKLNISKSTTHGLVQALMSVGALEQRLPGRKIFLGPAMVELAVKSGHYLTINQTARPVIDRLCSRINETVFLGVLGRTGALIMATCEPSKPLKISAPAGTTVPLLAGAIGKIYLARLKPLQAVRFLEENGLPRYTANTIDSLPAFLEELEKTRRLNYAVDNEEYLDGVRAVATHIGNRKGLPLALWVVGFAASMNEDRMPEIIEETMNAAASLKAILEGGKDAVSNL